MGRATPASHGRSVLTSTSFWLAETTPDSHQQDLAVLGAEEKPAQGTPQALQSVANPGDGPRPLSIGYAEARQDENYLPAQFARPAFNILQKTSVTTYRGTGLLRCLLKHSSFHTACPIIEN